MQHAQSTNTVKQGGDTHVLYRFYDANSVLLYIGITNNPPARFRQHRGAKSWWDAVANIKLETCGSRDALLAAERAAIKAEKPKYNIAMNCAEKPKPRTVRKPGPKPSQSRSEGHRAFDESELGCHHWHPKPACPGCGGWNPNYGGPCFDCQEKVRKSKFGTTVVCDALLPSRGPFASSFNRCKVNHVFAGVYECPDCAERIAAERASAEAHRTEIDALKARHGRGSNYGDFPDSESDRRWHLYEIYREQIEDAERDYKHFGGVA